MYYNVCNPYDECNLWAIVKFTQLYYKFLHSPSCHISLKIFVEAESKQFYITIILLWICHKQLLFRNIYKYIEISLVCG